MKSINKLWILFMNTKHFMLFFLKQSLKYVLKPDTEVDLVHWLGWRGFVFIGILLLIFEEEVFNDFFKFWTL